MVRESEMQEEKIPSLFSNKPYDEPFPRVVLSVDLCHSVKIEDRYGPGHADKMKDKLREIVFEKARKHKWEFYKGTGDGALIVFYRAMDAVLTAVQSIREFDKNNREEDEKYKIYSRFGIARGEIRKKKVGDMTDLSGPAADLACRIEGVKESDFKMSIEYKVDKIDLPSKNRILIDQYIYEEIKDFYGLSTKPLGYFKLKGYSALLPIYEVIALECQLKKGESQKDGPLDEQPGAPVEEKIMDKPLGEKIPSFKKEEAVGEDGEITKEEIKEDKKEITEAEKFPIKEERFPFHEFGLKFHDIMSLALWQSELMKHFYMGVEHIFLAYTKADNSMTRRLLQKFEINPDWFRRKLRANYRADFGLKLKDILEKGEKIGIVVTPRFNDIMNSALKLAGSIEIMEEKHIITAILDEGESIPVRFLIKEGADIEKIKSALERAEKPAGKGKAIPPDVRDVTKEAEEGDIGEIVGRHDEIMKIIAILSKTKKNNPLLIGEPGVGKTAVVEKLAKRIVKGKIEQLKGKRIYEIRMSELVAGTKYRGDFEEKMKRILKLASNPDVILFIDEIHTAVGAGKAEGSSGAADMLKPALARGEIRCIGATTYREYRKYFEKDEAFQRRFQTVIIKEPGEEETLNILKRLKESLQAHHQVFIEDEALETAVKLSVRYIKDRYLPDKAIDLVDEACSMLMLDPEKVFSSYKCSKDTKPTIVDHLNVTSETIAYIVEEMTGIPISVKEEEYERYARMEEYYKERIFGQDGAIDSFCGILRQSLVGLREPGRPKGIFLFTGPTGVGKTEMARVTAEFLFGDRDKMIRLDMSEFQEKHNVSRIIGSPPGYVGYEEEGELTGKLRKTPYSVVLLDEIEKAHKDVLNIFLQVFDAGRLTDARGKTVDVSNAIFIMTSNIGGEFYVNEIMGKRDMGFIKHEKESDSKIMKRIQGKIRDEIWKALKPEFISRLDDTIFFEILEPEVLCKIVKLELDNVKSLLVEKKIEIDVKDDVIKFLAEKGYDPTQGARHIRRAVSEHISNPLSSKIANGKIKKGDILSILIKDEKVFFTKQAPV